MTNLYFNNLCLIKCYVKRLLIDVLDDASISILYDSTDFWDSVWKLAYLMVKNGKSKQGELSFWNVKIFYLHIFGFIRKYPGPSTLVSI